VPVEDFDTHLETVDRLYRRFAEELRAFFKRRSRRHSPEDLVHIVFLHLLNCRGLSQVRDLKLYVYKIAWRVLYRENRRLRYEAPLPLSTDAEGSEESLAAPCALWDEETADNLADLGRAIETLRPEWKIVFLLYWIEDYTCEEVSAMTKINIHTVRKYVSQVMLHLRQRYDTNAGFDR
jgi:RNA polymerase sigma factor (sigma-70 family)